MTADEIGQIMRALGVLEGRFAEFSGTFGAYLAQRQTDDVAVEDRLRSLEKHRDQSGRFTVKDLGILLAGLASGMGIIVSGSSIGWW